MSRRLVVLFVFLTLWAWPLRAQAPSPPLTQEEVRLLIKNNKNNHEVVYKTLDLRGVDFDLNREIEKKMRKAGADDEMLQAIWKAGPTSKNAKTAVLKSATGKPLQATYEEAMGFKTLEDELDPDKKLRMVEEFANRFPNSELLSYVYTQAARACLQKNDWSLGVDYGRKSLKLDPDNFYSMLVLATTLAQPRSTLENANRLSTAQNNASHALALIATMQKGTSETDEQFQKRKQGLEADAHTALALVYMQSDESAKAIDEFKTAISLAEQPNPQLYFRMGEIYANEGKKDEAIDAFTKASQLGQGTIVQRYADDRIQKLKKQ